MPEPISSHSLTASTPQRHGTSAAASRWDHAGFRLLRLTFCALLIILLAAEIFLVSNVPYLWPIGGNDEPMHLSMAHYIANHLSWPRWDSPELERYFGTSYATSSSLNYWLEGLLQRLTHRPRDSVFVLFCIYAFIVFRVGQKNPIAGLVGVAAVVPQVLFVFSYLNSDAWTAIVALCLGLAIAAFHREPTRTRNIVLLFVAAAACLTCRHHLWIIGFLAFSTSLAIRLRQIVRTNPRALVWGLLAALPLALWWPVTSYFANDGDFVGLFTDRKAKLLFANPNDPELATPIDQIQWRYFFEQMGKSLYGMWGWAWFKLSTRDYQVAAVLGATAIALVWWPLRRWWPLVLGLLAVNVGLMIYGSTQFPALWQGRYLFPTAFLALSIALFEYANMDFNSMPRKFRAYLVISLLAFFGWNTAMSWGMWDRMQQAIVAGRSDRPYMRGWRLLHSGRADLATSVFRSAIQHDPEDVWSLCALGFIEVQAGQFAEARQHLEQARLHGPDDLKTRLNLGLLYLAEDKPHDAIAEFEAAIDVGSGETEARQYLARAYVKLGNYEEAIRQCRLALLVSPNNIAAQEQLKAILIELGYKP